MIKAPEGFEFVRFETRSGRTSGVSLVCLRCGEEAWFEAWYDFPNRDRDVNLLQRFQDAVGAHSCGGS